MKANKNTVLLPLPPRTKLKGKYNGEVPYLKIDDSTHVNQPQVNSTIGKGLLRKLQSYDAEALSQAKAILQCFEINTSVATVTIANPKHHVIY